MIKVDNYIAGFPEAVQSLLHIVRKTIYEAAPEAEECMSYGMPAYKQKGILIYFGAFKNHLSIFPTAIGISHFEEELKDFETSKGTIKIPFDKELPLDLITRIVQFKLKENLDKKKKKNG
jgi:uncharacterized protein YdhG (YjbR/CyaY superfamily)